MSGYHEVQIHLTKNQKGRLRKAKREGKEVSVNLSGPLNMGGETLFLTEGQIKKIEKISKKPRSVRIMFSAEQLQNQKGGFLGAIIPILSKVLPVLGTLGLSAASGAIQGATQRATRGKGVKGNGLYKTGGGDYMLKFGKKDIESILKAISNLEQSGALYKGSLENSMKAIEGQKGGFIGTLLAGLAGTLLPALFSRKGLYRTGDGISSHGGAGLLGKALNLPGGKVPFLGDIPLLGALF